MSRSVLKERVDLVATVRALVTTGAALASLAVVTLVVSANMSAKVSASESLDTSDGLWVSVAKAGVGAGVTVAATEAEVVSETSGAGAKTTQASTPPLLSVK